MRKLLLLLLIPIICGFISGFNSFKTPEEIKIINAESERCALDMLIDDSLICD